MAMSGNKRKLEYDIIIQRAIVRLPNGDYRLTNSDYPLSLACSDELYDKPSHGEYVASGYGVKSTNKDIENDYYEEISTIEKLLEEENIPIPIEGKPLSIDTKESWELWKKIEKANNLRALAMLLWYCFGIPWRYKNGFIHFIWSPIHLNSSPIIRSYQVEDFLHMIAIKEKSQSKKIEQMSKELRFWKTLGIILLVIIATIILYLFF